MLFGMNAEPPFEQLLLTESGSSTGVVEVVNAGDLTLTDRRARKQQRSHVGAADEQDEEDGRLECEQWLADPAKQKIVQRSDAHAPSFVLSRRFHRQRGPSGQQDLDRLALAGAKRAVAEDVLKGVVNRIVHGWESG